MGSAREVTGVVMAAVVSSAFNLLGEGSSNLLAGTLRLLIALAVRLSVLATFFTAYGASREKPLNVLLYNGWI